MKGAIGITGADGYLGGYLARYLSLEGYRIYGVDDLSARVGAMPKADGEHFVTTSATFDGDGAWRLLRESQVILHLGSFSGIELCERDPARAHAVNVEATRRLLHRCTETGIPIVLASSGAVHGNYQGVITESTPLAPVSVYAQTKALGDSMFRDTGMVVARMGNVYGGYSAGGTWIEKGNAVRVFLDRLIQPDHTLKIFEPGTQARTFIHISRVGRYWHRLAETLLSGRKSPPALFFSGEVFNIEQVGQMIVGSVPPEFGPARIIRVPNPRRSADAAGGSGYSNHLTRLALEMSPEEDQGDLQAYIRFRVRRLAKASGLSDGLRVPASTREEIDPSLPETWRSS